MAETRIIALCKRNVIYIRQIRVKHLELTLGYMGKFFNNGSMTMTFQILNGGLEDMEKMGVVLSLQTEMYPKEKS